MNERYSTTHIDYLQRTGTNLPAVPANASITSPQLRAALQIKEIGVFEKPKRDPRREIRERPRLPTEDLITGLHNYEISLGFFIRGTSNGVQLNLGSWIPRGTGNTAAARFTSHQSLIESSFKALYPTMRFESAQLRLRYDIGGIVLGVPTIKPFDQIEELFPYDRLIRAMFKEEWACVVLAQPVLETPVRKLRDAVFNEIRSVQEAVKYDNVPSSPQADHYVELLKASLKTLSLSLAVGCWRTAVYLLGNDRSYPKLASLWRGIFSGDDSLPEPIRIWESVSAPNMANEWAMPDAACPNGPGLVRHLAQYQTLLSSAQLSAYVHFPKFETNGFAVTLVPDFDTATPDLPSTPLSDSKATVTLGKVLPLSKIIPPDVPATTDPDDFMRHWYAQELPETYYRVGLKALTKHVFVAGVTGAGKTRTIFNILKNAPVPFLVIEPAKTEYRELLKHREVGNRLQVFTPGIENISPFRVNPFEVPEGTPIGVHIDLLRSLLSACFGWWNPLPQIFEKCANLLYADRGWDVAADFNRRTGSRDKQDPALFPTLSDLVVKADEIIPTFGYDLEAKGRVLGHFRATLLGLSTGAKGRMLDVERSIPMSVLLENPTVLELEGLGDDDDKAYMMGLLLIRLVEYRRSSREKAKIATDRGLRHILVIEEAHRLLTNVSVRSQEGAANPREKAVETFANLLAEIRKYGQGVIVADQVPTKLAPDIIKNTNLKIAHRIVDETDRKTLAGSMAMTEKQAVALATLRAGQAVVFAEGDDAPLLVQIAPGSEQKPPDDQEIHSQMIKSKVLGNTRDIFLRHANCHDTGEYGGDACEAARSVIRTPSFQRDLNRLVLSVLEDESAGMRLWGTIEQSISAFMPRNVHRSIMRDCVIAQAAKQYAERRGFQYQWSFQETAQVSNSLRTFFDCLAKATSPRESLRRLREIINRLCARRGKPYSKCTMICNSEPPVCLYRYAVADVIQAGTFQKRWDEQDPFNPAKAGEHWNLCVRVANTLVENDVSQTVPFRRIGLCFQQMMLSLNADELPESKAKLIDDPSVIAGHTRTK